MCSLAILRMRKGCFLGFRPRMAFSPSWASQGLPNSVKKWLDRARGALMPFFLFISQSARGGNYREAACMQHLLQAKLCSSALLESSSIVMTP